MQSKTMTLSSKLVSWFSVWRYLLLSDARSQASFWSSTWFLSVCFSFFSLHVTSCIYSEFIVNNWSLVSILVCTLTLRDINLTIMSFKSVTTISAEFQFPEPSSNAKGLNTESFTATVVKDSEAWFNYFNDYYMKVMQFKSYYDAVILEAQQLQNINITLTEKVSAFTQH